MTAGFNGIVACASGARNTANTVVMVSDRSTCGSRSVDPGAGRFLRSIVFRLPVPSRRSVVHPDHHHKLVLTADRVGLRFYGLELGTDCLQSQGIVVPAWLLLRFTLFHHALSTF